MQQLIHFIQKYKYFLYFLLLQFIALVLIINNHSFHKSKFISSANAISGGIYDKASNFSDYLRLKTRNEQLSEENKNLRNLLEKYIILADTISVKNVVDSLKFNQKYVYINGKITKNRFHEPYNFITINRGEEDGVASEMAVVNGKGIIGITDAVSNGYARVQSVLNKNSKINARFKNSFYFGTLTWNGNHYNIVQLTDIPRQASFKVGDTIITGGNSTIFPEGIPIGTVVNLPKKSNTINVIDIKLFNDMSNIGYIYVIKNLEKKEIIELEKPIDE